MAARRDDVVAVSPIVAGAALKGPADRMLTELGHESSVVGVARLYAPFAATLVIDEADADLAAAVEAEGMRCVVAPTIMHGPEAAALARSSMASATRIGVTLIPFERIPRCGPATCWPSSSPRHAELLDGDVVVVTQKVVSKAEGRLVPVDPTTR